MAEKLELKWSMGNTKLKKLDTVSFNLPAFKSADGFHVCPQAGACATMCYARQGRYMMPNVAATREFNLAKVRASLPGFGAALIHDLKLIKAKTIRLHDSGDFFSQQYLDMWCRVMAVFPEKAFYAYTKSLHLDWSRAPKNFQRIQSVGGLMDNAIDRSQSHSKIFATVSDRKRAGYVDGNKNDGPAIRGEVKIGLVYHGSRNLKPGQITYLKEAV